MPQSGASFRWTKDPKVELIPRTKALPERVLEALGMLADFFAAQLETWAKANAPWVDRTGNARQSLRAFAVKTATQVAIFLVGQVFYMRFLELGTVNMAPRPIILPTLERYYGDIMAKARAIIGGH